MKHFLVLFTLLVFSQLVSAQYLWYESKFECAYKDQPVIDLGEKNLTSILDAMVKEGKLFNFDKERNVKNDKVEISYLLLAEDESRFKAINSEWMKRASDASFKAFWQACPVRKDTVVSKAKVMYPVIKDLSAPVAVVPIVDEKPDPEIDYNIVVDFTTFSTLK